MPDPDGSSYLNADFLNIVLILLFFILGIIYSCCEAYLHNINEKKLKKTADKSIGSAKKLLKIRDSENDIILASRFALSFWGILSVSFASLVVAPKINLFIGLNPVIAFLLNFLISLLVFSLLFFILADLLPKKLIAHKSESFTFARASFIIFFYYASLPLSKFVNFMSNSILRIFGFDPKNLDNSVTEEEIILMVGAGEENGAIEEHEKDMIENILEFNDISVSEIMTHRTDICAIENTASIEDVIKLAVEEGFSRIPVYQNDIDAIVGICYVKDLLPYIGKFVPESITLTDIIRPAYFIPESKKCNQLFAELKERKLQIAVIIDEYGGTYGLITLEDLLESIVGNIQDEYDNEEEEIKKLSDYEFTVDGSTSINEVSDLAGFDLPEGDYDTIAGFITEKLGRILKDNEHPVIVTEGLEFKVLEVEDQRITRLNVKKLVNNNDKEDDDK